MRRFIAHGAPALLALFVVSILLPASEAEARFRRRGRSCGSCDSCGGGGCGTSSCATCDSGGSYSTGYRGDNYDNGSSPTPAQSRMTYDQQQPPPAPSGYNNQQSQGSQQSRGYNQGSQQSQGSTQSQDSSSSSKAEGSNSAGVEKAHQREGDAPPSPPTSR